MTSQELLEHLAEMKIPAKNHASTLVEAYVDKIRKNLAPIIAERQAPNGGGAAQGGRETRA